jgi:hypothetical protein
MAKAPNELVWLRLIYRGTGPVYWNGGPEHFGVQDKAEALQPGEVGPDGSVTFDLRVEVKPEGAGAPVFVGPLAHGPAGGRFLYLSWRNRQGAYAQRFKLPLGSIAWADIHAARKADQPLVGEVVDLMPRATSTGANIGGTRAVEWGLPAREP